MTKREQATSHAHVSQAARQHQNSIFTAPVIPSDRGESRILITSPYSLIKHWRLLSVSIVLQTQILGTNDLRELEKEDRTRANMADPPQSPTRHEESATTREEINFEENEHEIPHEQETGTVSPLGHETTSKPASPPARKSVSFREEEAPPAKPPRPMSPQQQAENTLIEAFPSIDTKVVKAVLMASGGRVEPAFNALLGMSDPTYQPEQEPARPPQPPRPQQRAPVSQLEADELYARQLAEQYNSAAPRPQNTYNQREPARRAPNQQPRPRDDEDRERNFFDDELPEIGKNIQQGFLDTQKKVNSWISNFKKRIDGEESEDEDLYSSSQAGSRQSTMPRQNFGSSQSEQLYGIQKQAQAQSQERHSTEANRYDADPHELRDDAFERLELRDDEAPPPQPPRTSSRKTANPDLFKSTTNKPPQSGPVDEVEAADGMTDPKGKKWQPLTSVAPQPDEDNDPFSLGDEEEDKGEDVRKDDTSRLKEAARNSISAGTTGEPLKRMEESGRSGSKNLEAEELLSGKKE